jgi:serine/threonine protein phosphatase 1
MEQSFPPGVAAQSHRVDRDAYDDVYVVGDVHGCLTALERLLDELGPTDDDLVVFVGDLVRRGPDSQGVVDLVRSRSNFLSVRGNNEEKLLRGTRTLLTLDEEDLRFLRSLPAVITWEGHAVIHGGLDPRKSRSEHTLDDVQNIASLDDCYWWESYTGPERVFFGHKPVASAVVGRHAVGLDTGAVYGGRLSAYHLDAGRVVSVDPPEEYHARADHKWVYPDEATPVGGLLDAPTGAGAE